MQARIKLQKSASQDVFLISRDGVIKRFGKDVIFVVKEGKAQMFDVRIIGFQGEKAAISSEHIHEGDVVVTKGNERLVPNQEVK